MYTNLRPLPPFSNAKCQLEYAGDYPNCLDGRPAQTTIEAMMPSRMLRVSGEQLMDFFRQDAEKMEFLLRQASPFGMPSGAVS